MATATITRPDGTTIAFSDLTAADMLALVNSTADMLAPAPQTPVHAPIPAAVIEKAVKVKANSDKTHTFSCGHSEPVSKGRYSALCGACKGNKASVVAETIETAQAPAQTAEKGTDDSRRESFEKWLETHGDEDMRPNMEKAIRRMLKSRAVTDKTVEEWTARLDASPRLTCRQASNCIQKLYSVPKRTR